MSYVEWITPYNRTVWIIRPTMVYRRRLIIININRCIYYILYMGLIVRVRMFEIITILYCIMFFFFSLLSICICILFFFFLHVLIVLYTHHINILFSYMFSLPIISDMGIYLNVILLWYYKVMIMTVITIIISPIDARI